MKNRLKASILTGAFALAMVGVAGCSSESSTAYGCSDIEKAMTPFWDVNDEFTAIPMEEAIPQSLADKYGAAQAQTVLEMQTISNSAEGDIAKMAELFAISVQDSTTPEGAEAGLNAYIMLQNICDIEIPRG